VVMSDETDETITYLLEVEKETWRPWSNTVPRQTSLDTRLRTLIEQDLRASQKEISGDEVSGKTVSVMATRIRIRAMQAAESIREDDDETAHEQLDEIQDIADALEQ